MQMIPFTPKPLAARQKVSAFNAALAQGVSSGFSVFSIKGKVWHLVRGDDRTLITKKAYDADGNLHDTGEPAASIEVVLLNANPNLSRVYYSKGYDEGSDAKPDCYSNNGKNPESDAVNPQSTSCGTCPHSQYGSRISDNGTKGWACANSRRIAVAAVSNLDEPILLRVPGASLKALVTYAKELDTHGYQFNEVVTRIGFDYSVAHPSLTFKAAGLIPPDSMDAVIAQANSDTVAQMIGTQSMPVRETVKPSADTPSAVQPGEPNDKPKAKVAAKPKPAAAAKLDQIVSEAESAPKSEVHVEQPVTSDIVSSLDDMLGGVSFDD